MRVMHSGILVHTVHLMVSHSATGSFLGGLFSDTAVSHAQVRCGAVTHLHAHLVWAHAVFSAA